MFTHGGHLYFLYSPVLAYMPLTNENENVLATPECQSSSTNGTSRNPIHAQTHFHRIRQDDRAGSSPFGVCLYLQDGDCEFLAVFRCKIKGDTQGAEPTPPAAFITTCDTTVWVLLVIEHQQYFLNAKP